MRWCSSAPPSRRLPETFFTMLTGWPPANGFAASGRMHVLGEQLGRPEIGRRLGDDDRASRRQLGGLAAASLAERIATGRSEALGGVFHVPKFPATWRP
eukprot:3550689-Prymnesium_polylepis.1